MLSDTLMSGGSMPTTARLAGDIPPQMKTQKVTRRIPVESDVRCLEVVGGDVWTGDRSGKISVRNARSGELLLNVAPKGGANVWSLCLVGLGKGHPSGHVWAGMSNGAILVYDSVTRRDIDHFHKHGGGIYAMVEHNGRVYSCSNDFEIFEWRATDHRHLRQFSGHKGYVRCILCYGATLLSGSDDNDIRIWDIATGQSTMVVQHHNKGVHAMVKVADNIWSAGGSAIVVWNLSTLSEVAQLAQHSSTILALTRAGGRVYSAGADHRIFAWDIYTQQPVGQFTDHSGWVYALCNTAKVVRYYLWSTSINDGCLQVWSHDEFVMQDNYTKTCEHRSADLLTDDPQATLAEHLQDSCEVLSQRCGLYESEVSAMRQRVTLLEDEIEQQAVTIQKQIVAQHKLTEALADMQVKMPRMERQAHEKDLEVQTASAESRISKDAVGKLRADLEAKDSRIRDLERKLQAANEQKDAVQAAHDRHKEAYIKHISTDIDDVLKQSQQREEMLRKQTESLRAQLVQALNSKRVQRTASPEDYLEHEAQRAMSAGRPRQGTEPKQVSWGGAPSLNDYHIRRFYTVKPHQAGQAGKARGRAQQRSRTVGAPHPGAGAAGAQAAQAAPARREGGAPDRSPSMDRSLMSPPRPAPPQGKRGYIRSRGY